MRALLALALLAYPAEFREEYGAHVSLDLQDHADDPAYGLRLIFDVLSSGIAMRADFLWRDITFALRVLKKAPVFTAVVVGTLAVAIAANAVIFSAIDAVLLQPLPFANTDRLVMIFSTSPQSPDPEAIPESIIADNLSHSPLIEGVGSSASSKALVRLNGHVITLHEGYAHGTYFETLGITPYVGTFFEGPERYHQIVLSYAFWKSEFGGDPSIVGKIINLHDQALSVVGVSPPNMIDPSYGGASDEDVWTLQPPVRAGMMYIGMPIARLRDGVSRVAVEAELNRLWGAAISAPRAFKFVGSSWDHIRLHAMPLRDAIVANTQSIWIVVGVAALLLLIACANIGNLMLARGIARAGEYEVRAALGATTKRIAAQTLAETMILSALGCFVGIALAAVLLGPTIAALPGNLPRVSGAHIDVNVVLFVCALGIGVTLIAGFIPTLRRGGRSVSFKRTRRTASVLVALEIAAAFTLLVCSALLLRSFLAVTSQPLGFVPRHGYIATFSPKNFFVKPPGQVKLRVVSQEILARVRALPGVTAAALTTKAPFASEGMVLAESQFWVQGQRKPATFDETHMATIAQISREFLSVAGAQVVQGRGFAASDMYGEHVVLVNQAFAKRFIKGIPPVGVHLEDGTGSTQLVLGVVADTRDSLTHDPTPVIYYPYTGRIPFFNILFRMEGPDPHLAAEISSIAQQVYPQFDLVPVTSLEQAVTDSAAEARTAFVLLSSFALVALILALAGIYGVVAFSVERRYHEIGVRLALGATRSGIMRNIVGVALGQSLFGVAAGVVAAAFATRGLESELFQTAPSDPASFFAAMALLLGCTALAAALPAWRAMGVDPARTLRYE